MSGKLSKFEDPPSASSSDEEEDEDDAAANSSSEEEEETDSESEAEPVPSPPVKPPADSKKVETSSKTETKKRSSETDKGEAKRVKRVSGEDEKKSTETKKTCFQRVWTEEDEIAVLQGIIDFKNQTGSSPYDDKNALYDLVKKSVSFDVTKTQFLEKIRALKKKFDNNLGRGKKKGKDPSFSKDHDRKAFDLAKLVWGDNGIMALESSSAGKKLKKVEPSVKKQKQEEPVVKKQEEPAVMKQEFFSVVELVTRFGVDDLAAKQGWSRLSAEDKERFEEQWKVLQLKEFRLYSQKSGFIHEVVTKMAENS
ncbi:unnamed protein product [Eruca vesicaria subsp. sativa]|uniref:Uncharacterized protein n=1 Tax=Eruca vesicaria subsp. sativa TaxID=29727 RepID=A0ABC8LNI3_ERUVS|nr:unnamed protein product [Eruca vesicaria subsp. sativa]